MWRMAMRVATDIGGTFTDLVYCRDGTLGYVKTDTVAGDFEVGVFTALAAAGISADSIEYFAHGSTIAINTLTERKGARTGLITTAGFRDVLEIGRGNTPDLFNINYRKPEPFVRRRFRREVNERTNYLGEVETSLDIAQLDAILHDFRAEGIEAIAVCFLHAYANSDNELEAVARIGERWPEVFVIASHQVCGEWREYERTSTAVASAYVLPRTAAYLDRLASGLRLAGHESSPFIMQSNGGITTVAAAKRNPISLVESGPASGILGAAALGRLLGEENLLALDIGGTTAKCALLAGGDPKVTTSYDIERSPVSPGYPIRTPVIDLVEIGNGGGSIAWICGKPECRPGKRGIDTRPGRLRQGRHTTHDDRCQSALGANQPTALRSRSRRREHARGRGGVHGTGGAARPAGERRCAWRGADRQREHDQRAQAGVVEPGQRSARFQADSLRWRRADARVCHGSRAAHPGSHRPPARIGVLRLGHVDGRPAA
jgi:N-methylhydantoinase A